ncbi:MAG TPA: hypothetical protein VK165_14825 [Azonexus sp.]|nr:hypothetical protein [Azonexus sp.]
MKVLLAALLLAIAYLGWRRWRKVAQARYLANFPLHQLLDRRLAARRPELDAVQRATVLDGLREYFLFCRQAGRRMVAMPSQAVDDAWHEFILFTRQYDSFCSGAFGCFLHHTPAEAMRSPTQASKGLRRAWRLACAHERIDSRTPDRLPRLFALDASLGIAGGFIYHLDCMAARQGGDAAGYCASHLGCSSGCGGGGSGSDGCSGDSGSGSGDSGGGGGCGGGGD